VSTRRVSAVVSFACVEDSEKIVKTESISCGWLWWRDKREAYSFHFRPLCAIYFFKRNICIISIKYPKSSGGGGTLCMYVWGQEVRGNGLKN
jgi:hypothetical protein